MITAAGASLALALCVANAQESATRQITYTDIVAEMPVAVEVNEREVDLLAHLIYAEGNTLGEVGMAYIGSVALNRVSDERFPNTLERVIYQDGQYACTWDGGINKTPSDVAYEVAEELLIKGSILPASVVWQSEAVQGTVYLKYGNTYFCY